MLRRIGSNCLSLIRITILPLFLLALAVGFFWQQVFLDRILGGYDIFTYFYPYKDYAAYVLRQGKIPLWNPYIFMGVPFLANIQSAVFYPINLLTVNFDAPQAVTISVIVHVFLAGLFMFGFCRLSIGLDRLSSLIGAIVFMFSGFMMQQVGHVNQLNTSVWIPLIFLLFDLACRKRSLVYAVLGGIAVALQFLAGHSQESYLTLFALGLFLIAEILRGTVQAFRNRRLNNRSFGSIAKWVFGGIAMMVGDYMLIGIFFGIIVCLGAALAAFQLLPTYELSQQSIRQSGLPYRDAVSFSLPPNQVLRALLPGFLENPFSEYVAYIGFIPLALALLAVAVRRKGWYTFFFFLMAALAFFMALGGFNPIYDRLYYLVPGLSLFRVPARWLYLYTFALSSLAAIGMNCFVNPLGGLVSAENAVRAFKRAQFWIVSTLLLVFGIIWLINPLLVFPKTEILAIWMPLISFSILLITVGVFWAPSKRLSFLILCLVIGELFFARFDLESYHPIPSDAYESMRPSVAQLLTDPDLFRILSISDVTFDPGDMNDTRLIYNNELPPERVTDLVVDTKYKEVLSPNLPMTYRIPSVDGYDGGVLPLNQYVSFKRLLLNSGGVAPSLAKVGNSNQPDGLLREQLDGIPDSKLLGLLNVKYILMDKSHDKWIDGAYYDLSAAEVSRPSFPLKVETVPPFESTSIGVVSHLDGGATISNTVPVATLTITDSDGKVFTTSLKAGVHTAEGKPNDPSKPVAHNMAPIASLWRGSTDSYDYYAKIDFGKVIFPKKIEISYTAPRGQLVVSGISLMDDRTNSSQSVGIDPHLRLVQSGDIKIYQNLDWLPRAYVVYNSEFVDDSDKAFNSLSNGFWGKVVLEGQPKSSSSLPTGTIDPAKSLQPAKIRSYSPEEIVIDADASSPGYLVLSDSYYPGWHASVDGVETDVLKADIMFKAVPLEPGSHVVRFWFEPESLLTGLTITKIAAAVAVTLLFLLGLIRFVIYRVRRVRLAKAR